MARLVISGYYGFGNAGDEAILASVVAALRSELPGTTLTVISRNPEATRRDHGVDAVGRLDAPGVLCALARSSALLSGGGSLLQDATSVRSLVYYLSVMTLAKTMGKKVMLFANGFGPVTSSQGKLLTRLVLNSIDAATFRDPDSLKEVRALGVNRPLMEVTADPVFLLDELTTPEEAARARDEARQALCETGIGTSGGPVIGISLRPWKHASSSLPDALRTAVSRLLACGARVVLLPLHLRDDLEFCEQVVQGLKPVYVLRKKLGPRSMMELIGLMDVLLGMRLHSLIFAVSKLVPCAAIPYDPKVSSFVATIGLPVAAKLHDAHPDAIYDTIDNLLRNRASYEGMMARRRIEQRVLARRNFELVARLLDER